MKNILLMVIALSALIGCSPKPTPAPKLNEAVAGLYNATLKPFYHGVASGDPLPNAIIIWTRVTPEDSVARIPVQWEMATDAAFQSIVQQDTASAFALKDYTVKVDVTGLQPGTTYYYRFRAMDVNSIIGRTKTAVQGNADSLQFAIASCSNWEWGYFTPYGNIAKREVLDAVLHLGDYIYEYGTKTYGDTTRGRINIPKHEIITLSDYRTRYSLYRTDQGLREVHQQQPFITIWDDHEIANNSYTEGAQNHQDNEGDYQARKAAARQAYYEWMPIRESETLYRTFSYGNLVDLIMLDERLAGRTKPVDSVSDVTFQNPDRHILGSEQMEWFNTQLTQSKATWKIIGNQVIYSDVNLTSVYPRMPRNLDAWDGYPAEKKQVRDMIVNNKINNVVFVTGDTHASWVIEAVAGDVYNPKTSGGAIAIELGTTSISSANSDEYKPTEDVKKTEQALMKANPHIKYVNDREHGYLLLTLKPQQARAEWYFVESLTAPTSAERLAKRVMMNSGKVRLE
jgi:alkaline phosphatase D